MSTVDNISVESMTLEKAFVSTYKGMNGHTLNGRSAALRSARQEAIEHFEALGFPGKKSEAWKYTNITSLLDARHAATIGFHETTLSRDDVARYLIPGIDGPVVVIENGVFNKAASILEDLPDGLTITDLQSGAENHSDVFDHHFGKHARSDDDAFVALNTAFARSGLFIHVTPRTTIRDVVQILSITTSADESFVQPRSLVVVEEAASLDLVERQISTVSTPSFSNRVVEIAAAKAARVSTIRIQDESSASTQVTNAFVSQGGNSVTSDLAVTLGGKVVRNNVVIRHEDTHCESHLNGLFVCRDKMHVDNHTLVDHAEPDCFSNEIYKGILYDSSTGVFNGKVLVRQDAQRTNAYQSNKSIVLSDSAHMYSKPELEIYADDVKCSHGATTGRLEPESLFYLRSRGLTLERARALLLAAFAKEVLESVRSEPVRDFLNQELNSRIR